MIQRIVNTRLKKLTGVIIATAAALLFLVSFYQVRGNAAGSSTISLSPSSTTVQTGGTFEVSVFVNSGSEAVNAAQVNLSYDASKLQLSNLNTTSDSFNIDTTPDLSNGSIKMGSGVISPVSGNQLFMKATFKALASGSATVQVANGSVITRASDSSDVWNGNKQSASFSITDPAPDPDPGDDTPPVDNGGGGSDPGDDTPPTDSGDDGDGDPTDNPPAGDLVVTEPSVSTKRFRQVIVSLETARPVRAKVLYGIEGRTAITSSETELTTTPRIELRGRTILPGRTYTYKVVLTEEDGTVSETQEKLFVSKGYRIKFVLRDRAGNLLRNLRVFLNSEPREGVTDENGEVIFEDVEEGDHTLSFEVQGEKIEQPVTVADNAEISSAPNENADAEDIAPLQVAEITADVDTSSSVPLVAGAAAGLVLLAVAGYYLTRRMQFRMAMRGSSASQMPQQSVPQDNYQSDAPKAETVITPDNKNDQQS